MQNIEAFVAFLKAELVRRQREKPKYSLRNFAKDLRVDPSFLSKVFYRKRNLSSQTFALLAKGLNLDLETKEKFLGTVPLPAKSGWSRRRKVPPASRHDYTNDEFRSMADWYHSAILELVRVRGFRPNLDWMAERLSVNPELVDQAVKRLFNLGFLEEDEYGNWKATYDVDSTLGIEGTTEALKTQQDQILGLAREALHEVPVSLRDQSAVIMAVNHKDLSELKKRISKFRKSIINFVEKKKNNFDEVQILSLSLFPVGNNESK